MITFSRILSHENDQIKKSKKNQAYIKLFSAGLIFMEREPALSLSMHRTSMGYAETTKNVGYDGQKQPA